MSETPIHNLPTAKETSEYLRIPLPTVYYLVQLGKIPVIPINGPLANQLAGPPTFCVKTNKANQQC